MNYDIIFEIVYSITFFIVGIAAVIIWNRRNAPGAQMLFWMMIAIMEWNLADLVQEVVLTPTDMIFWSKIAYLGAWTAQPLFLIFVLLYTQNQNWLTRSKIMLLFIMPVLTILLVFTNEYHRLIWSGFSPILNGTRLIYLHGPWFWISAIYINCIMVVGTVLLLKFSLHSRELFRYQNVWLVIATLFPWAGFILFVLPFNPFPGLDITAISFAITGTILVYIISRLNFLEIIPIARGFLVDNMVDGLLVLDPFNRIVDINPAALKIFNSSPASKWIGLPALEMLGHQSGLNQYFNCTENIEVEWKQNGLEPHYFDVHVLPLYHPSKKITGRSIIFRDITHHKDIEKALWQANRQLEEKLEQIEKLKNELRDQSIRDALTGLFNRRYIDEIFKQEFVQAKREAYPLSLIMIDLDHFKEFNDSFGHACGDQLLQALGAAFQDHFRISDIICRYGGDEFLLLMPNSDTQDAFRRIETFRVVCNNLSGYLPGSQQRITFSAGIAGYPEHAQTADELFQIADRRLYQAKAQGSNQTCLS